MAQDTCFANSPVSRLTWWCVVFLADLAGYRRPPLGAETPTPTALEVTWVVGWSVYYLSGGNGLSAIK